MVKTVYKSKIDIWVWIPVFLGMIICVGAALSVVFNWWIFLSGLLPIIYCADMVFRRTYYTIDEENRNLRVKCGFITDFNVNIDKIVSLKNTRTLLSAPAASIDRLEVKYGRCQSVVISPKDKQEFIAHLRRLNPEISYAD